MPIIGISSAIGLISFSISKSTTSVHFNGKTTTLKKLAIKFVNVLDQYIILCGQPLYFSTTALCFEVIKFRYSEKATKFAFWVSIFFLRPPDYSVLSSSEKEICSWKKSTYWNKLGFSNNKTIGRFLKILWPSQNIWTLCSIIALYKLHKAISVVGFQVLGAKKQLTFA